MNSTVLNDPATASKIPDAAQLVTERSFTQAVSDACVATGLSIVRSWTLPTGETAEHIEHVTFASPAMRTANGWRVAFDVPETAGYLQPFNVARDLAGHLGARRALAHIDPETPRRVVLEVPDVEWRRFPPAGQQERAPQGLPAASSGDKWQRPAWADRSVYEDGAVEHVGTLGRCFASMEGGITNSELVIELTTLDALDVNHETGEVVLSRINVEPEVSFGGLVLTLAQTRRLVDVLSKTLDVADGHAEVVR